MGSSWEVIFISLKHILAIFGESYILQITLLALPSGKTFNVKSSIMKGF